MIVRAYRGSGRLSGRVYRSTQSRQLFQHSTTRQVIWLPRHPEGYAFFDTCIVTLEDLQESNWLPIARSAYLGAKP